MASSFYATLEKTLQCPVCKKTYLDPHIPKQLPHCSHVCCQPCLESIAKPMQDICELACPECRTMAYIPKGGVGDLKTNVHLLNLAEAHHSHSLQKQQKQQQILLAKEATNRLSELSLQKDDNDYIEMRSSKPSEKTQQTDPKPPSIIQHTYLDTLPTKPVKRPLPEIPEGNHPPPPKNSQKFTHHKNPPVCVTPPTTAKENKRRSRGATNFMDGNLVQASSFGKFDQVQAVACTPDGLMAACDFSDKAVTIFERKQGKYKQVFQLELFDKNPRKPADVAILSTTSTDKMGSVSRKDQSVVVSKVTYKFLVARHFGIEVYTSKGKYERMIRPCPTDGICSVTTTEDGRILIGDIKRLVITEHDTEGTLLHTVKVKTKPARIEALSGSLVAISHFRSGKIELVDMATETSVVTVNVPEALGMHYLKKSDTLLVVSSKMSHSPGTILYNTGMVSQICCKSGQIKGQLISGLYHPFDLTVTHDGLLAIADEKKILVYRGNSQDVVVYETVET